MPTNNLEEIFLSRKVEKRLVSYTLKISLDILMCGSGRICEF